jgi:hypothetical protein
VDDRGRGSGLTFQRLAGIGGLLAFVTVNIGWIAGGLAQPPAYSSVRDDISDLGALTAADSWFYNQIGANLTGLLVLAVGVALWRALSPDVFGRIGAALMVVLGLGAFLDGLFRLDCRGIDTHCDNTSWHAHAHKIESGFTGAATLLAPLVLAFAFRRIPAWRDSWLPSVAAIVGIFGANLLFSAWGDGAATRAGTDVALLWVAFIGLRLIQKGGAGSRPRVTQATFG